jgi:alpha-D-xyloside xylohydrolase
MRRIQRAAGAGLLTNSRHLSANVPHRHQRLTQFFDLASLLLTVLFLCFGTARAETPAVLVTRDGSTIVLEPYAPNVIRVTLSLKKDSAQAAPGYGFVATPAADGWTHQQGDQGDVYQSSRMVVTVGVNHPGKPMATEIDIAKFFNGSAPPADISIRTPEGKLLLQMTGWSMSVPNHKDANAELLNDRRASDPPFYQVGATFVSPDDEHYYGLGQYHDGFLDQRGHRVECWQNYIATGGPSVCVPFMVTNYGYGIIWDNPSKTVIEPGFNEQTRWTSEVGDRVSFFVIAGKTSDEIYSGYRLLTGATPMLPKGAYGYIQCKQRYA